MRFPRSPAVRRYAVISALLEVQLWFPVWLIFLTDRGFSVTTAVLADGVFRIVLVALELPFGVLSDRIGRLRSLRLWAGLTVITYAAVAAVETTWQLFAVWTLWGALWALMSGTASAYLYELVRHEDLLGDRVRIFGLMRVVGSASVLTSHLAAGVLYRLHPTLPFVATAAFGAAALALTRRLPAVGVSRTTATLRLIIDDLRVAWRDGALRTVAVLLGLLLLYGWSVRILFQPLALDLRMSATATGAMYFGFSAASILAGIVVARFAGPRPGRWMVAGGFAAVWAAVIATSLYPRLGPWLFVPLIGFGYHLACTVLEVAVNDRTHDALRATLLSAVSAVGGVVIAGARPALGAIADSASAAGAFGVWAVVGAVVVMAAALVARWHGRSAGWVS